MTGKRPRASFEKLISSGLTLKQLRLIAAMEESGTVHGAAATLNISQPAASKLLAQMELMLGVDLFFRRPRGLVATIYGEALLRHARAILAELGLAADEIVGLRGGGGGRLAVGSVMSPAVETIATVLGSFRDEFPSASVNFEIETSDVLITKLLDHKFDLVIARIPADLDPGLFDYEELAAEEVVLLVRTGHEVAPSGLCPPSAAVELPWVLQHRGSLLRSRLESFFRRHRLSPPQRVVETSSFLAALAILSVTDAIAPLPLPVARFFSEKGQFRILRLPEPLIVEPYGLIRIRGRIESPISAVFYRRLHERISSRDPAGGRFGASPHHETIV